ncbi:MAG: TolC family protein [Verrucomicrobia bacterium]|nr:TolC family protein [Cytophagales bacterium]
MKKISMLFVYFLVSAFCFAQNINYNNIVSPTVPTDIGEKLVYLAWQNLPVNTQLQQQILIADASYKEAKNLWLNDIGISSNLNEINLGIVKQSADPITGNVSQANLFNPFFNLGIAFRFGTPTKIAVGKQKATAEKTIAEQKINQAKITLRALVLRTYENYKTFKALRDLQRQVTDETTADFSLAKQKLNSGKLPLEDYNKISQYLNIEKSKLIDAESKFNLSRIDLEEQIGVKLKEVGLE